MERKLSVSFERFEHAQTPTGYTEDYYFLIKTQYSDSSIESWLASEIDILDYLKDGRRMHINGITKLSGTDFYIAKYDLKYSDIKKVGLAALYAGEDDKKAMQDVISYAEDSLNTYSEFIVKDVDEGLKLWDASKKVIADLVNKAETFINICTEEHEKDFVESLNTLHSSQDDVDDFDITRADYDDAEEIRLVEEYNKQRMNSFREDMSNLSEAANELKNEVFGYIPQALDNLINTVSQLADPYLNMMYADEDFEAFVNYDPSDDYYVDDFSECYAA